MASGRTSLAAGGVVWRKRPAGRRDLTAAGRIPLELLLVHRPDYDDWTFPKGKVDPGETLQQTAVREIAEESGLRVRLGHPLQQISYPISGGTKQVSYWMARQLGNEESTFRPNKEIDEVRWVRPSEAGEMLSYSHDRALLEEFRELRERKAHRARTLVVVRHGKAVDRDAFSGDDLERPLASRGVERARQLTPILSAYGVGRVISSPALRCIQTVEPYAHSIGTFLQIDDRLSEQTRAAQVERSMQALMDRKRPVAVCSHRPTLPWIFDAAGAGVVDLTPGSGLVIHHRAGRVLATESL